MASRVLGFVRDVMIAGLLGAGPVAEAFFVAFRLPNMFRRFFAEGAFNMAFVPLFAKRLEGGEDPKGFAEEAMAGLIAVLLLLTILAQIFMPTLILVLAAGFADDPERFRLATLYGRIQFPYLFCMALTALFSGVLNAMGRFAAPAAAPVLLNIILIGAMTVAVGAAAPVGSALALGVLAAGFAQVWLVARAARMAGMTLAFRRPRWSPAMRRLVALGVPGALAGGVMQINLLIGTAIASFFTGAIAWLSYSDRLYQLPLGVVGVAIGVVLLPELSRRVRAGDDDGARNAFCRATEFSMALTLPAAAALAAIAGPLASVLFARGAFTAADAAAVAAATAIFAFGLPAFVMQKVVQPAFFAREDTKSPLRYALASVALNTAISLAGAPLIGWLAIPIGTMLAGWLNLALLWRGARAFGAAVRPDERLSRRLPRILVASVLMAVAVRFGAEIFSGALAAPGLRYAALALLVAFGGALYSALALAFGAASMADLKAALRR
ncbi:murein biosynthesis integral membrane protein MurJ [Pikeienuella piscinae]|uniref:Probable lipid II flippase MurJ n=2 Tax=Pikeienuella piscinae TaxID=2748098 RepID=A0A7M3T708_9RHOB|nr:murein biosynthesis integral membrane protein MurJ [Pikeienuella piscinae]QIE57789.1 murein biosynthesis integral membrane protein MurJ [Pikeienuella piscinae]